MNLLDFLLERHKDISRNKLKGYLSKGAVQVDGQIQTKFDFQVTSDNKVEIIRDRKRQGYLSNADRNMRHFAQIVYEDKWLIVIDKHVGVLSVPSGHHSFSLKNLLDEYLQRKGEKCTAHVVHRLDKETSGLMLFAKSRQVQEIFTSNWHEIIQDRRYYAVTSGIPTVEQDTLSSWLLDDKFYYTHSSPVDNGGKWAVTHYQVIATSGRWALLDVKLDTGRKNQIRVHLQDIDCPVIGDLKYGNGDDPAKRLGLHAYLIRFQHPITGKSMEFKSVLPPALEKIVPTPDSHTDLKI